MSNILYIKSDIPLGNMVRLFGTTWTVYVGTLYGLTPILVLATYLILKRDPFHTSTIFKYLRLNALNSLILCVLLTTGFLITIYKFDFTNNYFISFYAVLC